MKDRLRTVTPAQLFAALAALTSLGLTSQSVRDWLVLIGEFMQHPLALTIGILIIAALLVWLLMHSQADRAALREELQRSQTCILAMSMILSQDWRFRGKLPDAQLVIDGEMSMTEWMNRLNALNVPSAGHEARGSGPAPHGQSGTLPDRQP